MFRFIFLSLSFFASISAMDSHLPAGDKGKEPHPNPSRVRVHIQKNHTGAQPYSRHMLDYTTESVQPDPFRKPGVKIKLKAAKAPSQELTPFQPSCGSQEELWWNAYKKSMSFDKKEKIARYIHLKKDLGRASADYRLTQQEFFAYQKASSPLGKEEKNMSEYWVEENKKQVMEQLVLIMNYFDLKKKEIVEFRNLLCADYEVEEITAGKSTLLSCINKLDVILPTLCAVNASGLLLSINNKYEVHSINQYLGRATKLLAQIDYSSDDELLKEPFDQALSGAQI